MKKIILLLSLLFLITYLTPAGASAEEPFAFDFHGLLYKSLFYPHIPEYAPSSLPLESFPGGIKKRIREYVRRSLNFRSRLPASGIPKGPELWLARKRASLEQGIVSLISAKNIEQLAADSAAKARLFYEWEGLSDPPLEEARFAQEFLKKHPQTPLRPYLLLFILNRASQAIETMKRGNEAALTEVQKLIETSRSGALTCSDPLVEWMARDLERNPEEAGRNMRRETREQVVRIFVSAIREGGVSFAVIIVPKGAKPVRLKSGLVPEELPSYSKIATGLTLARLELKEKTGPIHDIENVLYISYLMTLVEGLTGPPFICEPGSTWLLGLESPFKKKTPLARELMKKYAALGAEAFLSENNYFLIGEKGYAALCLSWPEEKKKPDNLLWVSPVFIDDFKLILDRFKPIVALDRAPESREALLKKLRDPLARSILNSL